MDRRSFVAAASLSALPLTLEAAPPEARKIRVTGMEVFHILVEKPRSPTTWILVRLQTDAGVTGLGEASHSYDDAATLKVLKSLEEIYRNRGIFDTEFVRLEGEKMIKAHRLAAITALSGFEMALWDLQGKVLGVPCYQLFGGAFRTEIRNYANINRSVPERTPAGFSGLAAKAREAGFTAVKLAPFDGMPKKQPEKIEAHIDQAIETLRQVRQVMGPERDVLTDVHSTVSVERGLRLVEELEPLNLFWVEEVPSGRGVEDSARITQAAKMPHAGGESLYGVKEFLPYVAARSWDVLMPDVKYCGGMYELKKIASLGEAAGLPVSPHGPASPVGNLAAGHVCASMPNFLILEHAFGEVDWRAEIVKPPEPMRGGTLVLSDRPGLGVEVNEKLARQHPVI